MSMTITLVSAAVVASMSLALDAAVIPCLLKQPEGALTDIDEGLETVFEDADVLVQTLEGADCHYQLVSPNEIHVKTACGDLVYKRETAEQPFLLYLSNITDQQALIENMRSFTVDYGRNVQSFVYHHIKESLPEGMSIESEDFDEDDSLCLTLRVE